MTQIFIEKKNNTRYKVISNSKSSRRMASMTGMIKKFPSRKV